MGKKVINMKNKREQPGGQNQALPQRHRIDGQRHRHHESSGLLCACQHRTCRISCK